VVSVISGKISTLDKAQGLRYLGYNPLAQTVDGLEEEIAFCEREILSAQRLKAVYKAFDLDIRGDEINLGFAKVNSKSLAKNLDGCKKVAVFACTIGAEVDRLIAKYQKISPTRSLIFQAFGSALAEQWADIVNGEIKAKFGATVTRFSCGYGDLPIEMQKDVFCALSVEKNLGITLSKSYFMTPTKSITAFVGIKN